MCRSEAVLVPRLNHSNCRVCFLNLGVTPSLSESSLCLVPLRGAVPRCCSTWRNPHPISKWVFSTDHRSVTSQSQGENLPTWETLQPQGGPESSSSMGGFWPLWGVELHPPRLYRGAESAPRNALSASTFLPCASLGTPP